jgi:hypothetical protein
MSIDTPTVTTTDRQASLARKHRKLRLHRDARSVDDANSANHELEVISSDEIVKPHPTGIKHHARYDPGVAMNRDELTAWRKEARRVRNRESAAESRKRTRDRIDELEGEVAELNKKYKAALARILELESGGDSSCKSLFTPRSLSQDEALFRKDPDESRIVTVSPCPSQSSSPILSPVTARVSIPFSLSDNNDLQEQVEQKYKNIMSMISRPAVSI